MRPPLRVAVAQPPWVAGDLEAASTAHAALVEKAQARLVVFPELSLTGYDLEAPVVDRHDPRLDALVAACSAADAVALIGAPIVERSQEHIATLAVTSEGVEVVYRKSYLGVAEAGRFRPGPGVATLTLGNWVIGFGICKDTGVPQHVADTARMGVDLYVAGLVHRPDELDVQHTRAATIAKACDGFVAFASFAGEAGPAYRETAGHSAIYAADGSPIVMAGLAAGEVVGATLQTQDPVSA